MSSITLDVPDKLAARLRETPERIPQILELVVRQIDGQDSWPSEDGLYRELNDVLEYLAELPSPEEVIALRPSPALAQRISNLLEKNRSEGLTPWEEQEFDRYEYLEHLVGIAKAKALIKLKKQ